MRLLTVATMCVALSAGGALAKAPTIAPRAKVEAIAAAIDGQFYDEARAHKIAAELRAEAKKGDYDKLTDPLDFAAVLTARLRPQDGHFAVNWSPAAPDMVINARPGGGPAALTKRGGYGFRSVQVLPGNIGYIDMRGFAHFEPTGDQSARLAADAALALTAGTDALIFDLRDNGGGSPAMVGYLVGHFVPDGSKIYNTFKVRGQVDAHEAPTVPIADTARRLQTPIYILTSGRTASAGEAFAYTLQAAKRATVVGEASAGGANPGGPVEVGDGLSVFISVGTPINPITGKNWEGTGVTPDVPAPVAQALDKAQQVALTQLASAPLGEPALSENRWALEALAPAAKVEPAKLAGWAGTYGAYEVSLQGDSLLLRSGRRPPVVLKPLSSDGLFVVEGAPSRRVLFEDGAVVLQSPDGGGARQARNTLSAAVK